MYWMFWVTEIIFCPEKTMSSCGNIIRSDLFIMRARWRTSHGADTWNVIITCSHFILTVVSDVKYFILLKVMWPTQNGKTMLKAMSLRMKCQSLFQVRWIKQFPINPAWAIRASSFLLKDKGCELVYANSVYSSKTALHLWHIPARS